jgi:ketosteroid isomerase-like protein
MTDTATSNGAVTTDAASAEAATTEILAVAARWEAAELAGDTAVLRELLTDDFVGVGPLGFVLNKQAWLGRHSPGALTHTEFSWHDVQVRVYGSSAVAVGIEEAKGSFGGHPIAGKLRSTHILVRSGGQWRIAGVHVSAIGRPGA